MKGCLALTIGEMAIFFRQNANIALAIHLYEVEGIPKRLGTSTWLADEKVLNKPPTVMEERRRPMGRGLSEDHSISLCSLLNTQGIHCQVSYHAYWASLVFRLIYSQ